MKRTYSILLCAAAIVTLASCRKENPDPIIPDSDKEMISFSLSDGTGTKAGFTGADTHVVMRILSDKKGGSDSDKKYTRTVATANKEADSKDYSTITFNDSDKRYWDDAHGRSSMLSVYAVAVPNGNNSVKNDGKTLEELISKGDASNTWGTTSTNTIAWKISTSSQTKDESSATSPSKTIDLEDLVYSNNIKDGGSNGIYRYDYSSKKYPDLSSTGHKAGRMLFYQEDMTDADASTHAISSLPGHFDKGHLEFNHALSRMTISLVKGEGFGDFNFDSGTNIKVYGMNITGTLDLAAGTWGSLSTGTIDKLAKTTAETTAAGTYLAQVIPGFEFTNGSNDNVLEFTIDNNTYYVTKDQLFDALKSKAGTGDGKNGLSDSENTKYVMEQGKNYTFQITVKKTKIEAVTATLANWDEVTASNMNINNAHVAFTFGTSDGTACTDFQFYRHKQGLSNIVTTDSYSADTYQGDYKTEGAATITGTDANKYSTNWYFEDNQTAYHFRTLNELAADEDGSDDDDKSENIHNTSEPVHSYFKMKADATKKDYHWGAPMIASTETNYLKYDISTGFKNSLYKGLIATESDVKIMELHMMSNLNIVLKTSTDGSKVNLDGATVKITKLATEATVDMGIGLITPSTTITDEQATTAPSTYWKTENTETNAFTCAVIPQELKRSTEYVGITITTSDNNQYYVVEKLANIVPCSVGSQKGQQHNTTNPIIRWYPNHSYTYTFTITKKGIESITCTVADWVTVDGGNTNIDLES